MMLLPSIPTMVWGGNIRLIGRGLGLEIDDITEEVERLPLESSVDNVMGRFEKGTQGAFRLKIIGWANGRERIVVDHVTRIDPACAPQWPQPDEGVGDHRVIVDGDPQLTIVSRADVPGGTRADGGNTTAANRLLGAIDWLATQKPGITTVWTSRCTRRCPRRSQRRAGPTSQIWLSHRPGAGDPRGRAMSCAAILRKSFEARRATYRTSLSAARRRALVIATQSARAAKLPLHKTPMGSACAEPHSPIASELPSLSCGKHHCGTSSVDETQGEHFARGIRHARCRHRHGLPTSRRSRLPATAVGCPAALATDFVGEIPADRWDADAYYDPEPGVPGRSITRWGAFLDDVGGFDCDFFGMTEREAIMIDPQHRLLLEASWDAFEHAGLDPAAAAGSRTGVFVGLTHGDYELLAGGESTRSKARTGSAAPTRVSPPAGCPTRSVCTVRPSRWTRPAPRA